MMVDGLERALAQARTKIPDHDSPTRLGFPSPREDAVRSLKAEVPAPVPFDSRAVMDVLRGAIDRYTHGDGHKQGAWVEELSKAKDKAAGQSNAPSPNHLAAGYAPDRRRLAAVVVVLFLLVGGVAYTQFGVGGSSEKVKTNTPVTIQGRAVTTQTLPTTSAAPTTTAPTTETSTEPAPASTVQQQTSTTVRHATGTTAPPATDPPPTTDTTPPPTTDTTPPTTTPTTTATTSTDACAVVPKPDACP
jgi:hypothetical protein